jgi:hypothetical protein
MFAALGVRLAYGNQVSEIPRFGLSAPANFLLSHANF